MKQTLKLCFFTMIFTLLAAFSSLASGSSAGHLDFFDESGISGWFYETGRPGETASFSIRLTNAVTGEIVQEIPMTSSLSRPDLESRTGKRQHSRFLHFHRLECSGRRSLYSIHHKRRQNSGQFSLPLFRKQEQRKWSP